MLHEPLLKHHLDLLPPLGFNSSRHTTALEAARVWVAIQMEGKKRENVNISMSELQRLSLTAESEGQARALEEEEEEEEEDEERAVVPGHVSPALCMEPGSVVTSAGPSRGTDVTPSPPVGCGAFS